MDAPADAESPPLEISVQEAHRCLAENGAAKPRVIDCRDPEEFDFNRLPGAELLPLSTLPSEARAQLGGDTDAPLLVYCHHGMRSARATQILRQLGYRNARSLAGGIDCWSLEVDPAVPRY